eukprot:407288-Pyramimonas_sp.AAC.1
MDHAVERERSELREQGGDAGGGDIGGHQLYTCKYPGPADPEQRIDVHAIMSKNMWASNPYWTHNDLDQDRCRCLVGVLREERHEEVEEDEGQEEQ